MSVSPQRMLGLEGHLLQGEEMTHPGAITQPAMAEPWAQDQKDQSSQFFKLLLLQRSSWSEAQQNVHSPAPRAPGHLPHCGQSLEAPGSGEDTCASQKPGSAWDSLSGTSKQLSSLSPGPTWVNSE